MSLPPNPPTFQYPISIYMIVIVSIPWSVSVWLHRQFWVTCSTIQDCQWSLPCSTIQFLLEGTVKFPERVRFWHENVHFSVNHSSSCKKSYAVIGLEVFIHTRIVHVQELWWQQKKSFFLYQGTTFQNVSFVLLQWFRIHDWKPNCNFSRWLEVGWVACSTFKLHK